VEEKEKDLVETRDLTFDTLPHFSKGQRHTQTTLWYNATLCLG